MNTDQRGMLIRTSLAVALLAGSGGYLAWSAFADKSAGNADTRPTNIEVKRAVNGHTVKFEPNGKLTLAGVRAPYEDESFFEEARIRANEIMKDKEIRLRYDEMPPDRDDRIVAWAFLNDRLINESLVGEGLAYVRLTPEQSRYSEQLLAAQARARSARRGIWSLETPAPEAEYAADPKYGNFHRKNCEESSKIKVSRLVTFSSRDGAFSQGFAPCNRCKP